jgi:hypothetical protein
VFELIACTLTLFDSILVSTIDEGIVVEQIVDIPHHLQDKRLFELVDEEGNWNWNLLNNWLPEAILNRIAAVTPPSTEHGDDERVLAGCNRDNFTVAGMYSALTVYRGDANDTSWRQIWKLHVPERVRSFVWLIKDYLLIL